MKTLAIIGGCFCIVIVLVDGFNTIIVARRTQSVFRLARLFYSVTWSLCAGIAKRIDSGRIRESFLGIYGPLSVLTLLALWEMGMMTGFGLIQWGAGMRANGRVLQLGDVWYVSAVTLLTLDTGNPQNTASRIVSALEGGIGLTFLALIISYLPVLYQAYSSREQRITLLDARAGSPPSAAELLLFDFGDLERLEHHLAGWEEWSAELLETNLSFPMLAFFRSQHINQSWLSALTTVMDTAAVAAICGKETVRTQAGLTLAMGRHALVDLAKVFDAKPPNHRPNRLSTEDFNTLRNLLGDSGAQWLLPALSENQLNAARQLYEPYAQALSSFLLIGLPAWFPDEGKRENWRRASKRRKPDGFAVSDPYRLPEE
jgi:hypothetical protein